ncbi:EVE domain-containing protein [Hahella sp. HN01]|uniref:EVE domain-containing protein n=1 Tax=Hahella sp. HN01 TaxID=2847262 RepID=UPI001C1EC9FA|nr:EVE domain-containing protein [Hahella sp. HN01]MBU6954669.1 EVE domain-containing protein [Hahella sp. HN01]
MAYWLMKTEPDAFSIDDLANSPEGVSGWDGVRNYQARNFMRDDMKVGDQVFIYHSSCPEPGVAGIAEVCREAYPDPSSFDPESPYYDPKSTEENPRWWCVSVKFVRKLKKVVPLGEIKLNPALQDMALVKRSRLSVMPVESHEWDAIMAMT